MKTRRLFGWSESETENLKKGVSQFGEDWDSILSNFQFHYSRNSNSLRKKWKRIKTSSNTNVRTWTSKEWYELEEGVKKYGQNWKKILETYNFQKRSANALGKKWRYEMSRKKVRESSFDNFDANEIEINFVDRRPKNKKKPQRKQQKRKKDNHRFQPIRLNFSSKNSEVLNIEEEVMKGGGIDRKIGIKVDRVKIPQKKTHYNNNGFLPNFAYSCENLMYFRNNISPINRIRRKNFSPKLNQFNKNSNLDLLM